MKGPLQSQKTWEPFKGCSVPNPMLSKPQTNDDETERGPTGNLCHSIQGCEPNTLIHDPKSVHFNKTLKYQHEE